MPTKIKIPEDSFRVGAGRYIQCDGAILRLYEEIERLGAKRPFIIGGRRALTLAKDKIQKSLDAGKISGIFYTYEGFCVAEVNEQIVKSDEFAGCDIVVGVGGGNVMDAAKHCAVMAGLPIINIPTSSATCAAYTPLSVCYNKAGQTVGTVHHKVEVNAVLVDMEILSKQPVRLLLAGIYDSLAKQYELYQRMLGVSVDETDIGLAASHSMSGFIYELLMRNMEAACRDTSMGKNTKTVYDVVNAIILLTGTVSGLARGSNQTAIAHKVYECSRKLYPDKVRDFLHGELVALGLVVQIAYNGQGGEKEFAEGLRARNIPASLSELGLPAKEAVDGLYAMIIESSAMAGTNDAEKQRLKDSLNIIM